MRKFEITEMRMLRWICGCTMLDRIPNRLYREKLSVVKIGEKLREGRLRCSDIFVEEARRNQSGELNGFKLKENGV